MNTGYNDLLIIKNPKSRFAEAIKTVRTNLAFANVDEDNKVILITSCEPGDGKSFISANLAIAYAQEAKKVLIIDCDLRKGRQHNIWKIPNSTSLGYSNLVIQYKKNSSKENSDFNIDNYIQPTVVQNVSVIPCGPIPPNPTELLASKSNQELVKELASKFDIVIIDCTPTIGLSDAAIMTKCSDINLLVVSNKKTTVELVNRAKKAFKNVNSEINGVILNQVSTKDIKYGNYYSDSYYGAE